MPPQRAMVRAKFDGKGLVVIDRSPELQAASDDLLAYLNDLGAMGWHAVQGRFEGWEVILALEKQTEIPYKILPAYMLILFKEYAVPEGLTSAASVQNQLLGDLEMRRAKEGWETLAGPKHFGGTTLALWVKTFPV